MNREQGMEWLERTRIIVIARGVDTEGLLYTAEALLKGGIRVMEVTLNTATALESIQALSERYAGELFIGAGTVLSEDDADRAELAGAQFIVTPHTDAGLISHCAAKGMPIYPGALTPTEIMTAWNAGASAIKLFPSASMGIGYVKELMGPFDSIPFIPVGGVNVSNAADFIRLGCYALGVGGSLINRADIDAGRFAEIERKARALIEAAASRG